MLIFSSPMTVENLANQTASFMSVGVKNGVAVNGI